MGPARAHPRLHHALQCGLRTEGLRDRRFRLCDEGRRRRPNSFAPSPPSRSGRRSISDDIAREIAAERLGGGRSLVDELGSRETEILRLVALGLTTGEIANALCLSPKTVQNYTYQIKSKIGARTDAHLVWLAIGAGLVKGDGSA